LRRVGGAVNPWVEETEKRRRRRAFGGSSERCVYEWSILLRWVWMTDCLKLADRWWRGLRVGSLGAAEVDPTRY